MALTCLKKKIEKAEEINVAKYDKIIVWSDGCSAQVCSRFVFPSLNGEFFWWYRAHVELQRKKPWKRSHGWCWRDRENIIFRKVDSGFVTIDSPFEFHQAILKFVPSIKSVYSPGINFLNEPENIKQESKKIPETLKIHHVERFEVKEVYGLKFFDLAEYE